MAKTLNAKPVLEPLQDTPFSKPTVKIDRDVMPLLSGRKPLVDHLADLVTQEQVRCNIPPYLMEIKLHVDAESGQQRIHIKQTVATDAKTALEYWDKVSVPVDEWISTLPQSQADTVRDEILLTIHWKFNVSGQ